MAEITEKEIESLKAKHGEIFKLTIPLQDDEVVLILKKLDRVTYSAGSKLLEKDELLAAEMFLRSLTVAGPVEDVIKDFEALRIAASLLGTVISTRSGNVAKL